MGGEEEVKHEKVNLMPNVTSYTAATVLWPEPWEDATKAQRCTQNGRICCNLKGFLQGGFINLSYPVESFVPQLLISQRGECESR